MNDLTPENREPIRDLTSDAAELHAELKQLRKRLAALEASVPHGQPTVRKPRRRLTPKMLTLLVAGVMLAGATIVFGQDAVDSLFISTNANVGVGTHRRNAKPGVTAAQSQPSPDPLTITDKGNVGIGTASPANKLSVAGNTDVTGNLSVTGSVGVGTVVSANRMSVAGNGDFSGNVGVGTATPAAKLDVVGSGWFRNDQGGLPATAGKGVRVFYDVNDVGQIFSYDYATSNPRNLVLQAPGGNVGIGTTSPQAKLEVAGNMRVTGNLISQGRYQRDDAAETTYEISPRYHLSLTHNTYDGRTRQIPQQVIIDLCADYDGCQFRLGMTRYAATTGTETASITGIMYYSTTDRRWRASSVPQGKEVKPLEAGGIDGNNRTEHVADAWSTCFFTDSPYSGYQDQSDPTIGMYLLLWNGYPNPGRTCELTLID